MASDDPDFNNRAARNAGRIAEGVTAARHMPRRYGLSTGKYLSRSTRAGIMDHTSKQWLIRLDNPHRGVNTPHININSKLTGVKDPHLPIPGSFVKGGEVATKLTPDHYIRDVPPQLLLVMSPEWAVALFDQENYSWMQIDMSRDTFLSAADC